MEVKEVAKRKKAKPRHIKSDRAGRPWPEIPFEDKKVMVYCTVKRKNFKKALAAIRKLCEQWR